MSIAQTVAAAAAHLPASVPATAKVYKDECMYLFDTPENNPLGVDVCMSCFQAFARTNHKNYTAEHYADKVHRLYVNITKTLKPVPEEDTRKKAKLEIKEQKESDIYDTATSVYVAAHDALVAISELPDNAIKLVNEILAANSASTVDDIKAWELQVYPCEHLVDIQIEPAHTDLFKCALCDLTENLWVCLTCGSVGCGREQYGSSLKGNSHALTHFEVSGHAVAAKLGSLSADEDSCDCYCYQCNDEVKVPGLAGKLLAFGVDLASAVKTEKNLVELNLDTNKNWQFNLDGADGDRLRPVFGPALTGMQNLGNLCYLNSVVQSLFSFESYQNFYRYKTFDKSVEDPALDLPSQMLKMYDGLISGRYSRPSMLKGDDYQAGIRPGTFKALIGADHAEFRTNKQQDAFEFLLYLMDMLDKQYGLELNHDFKFVMTNRVVCTHCNAGSVSQELVDNVSVPISEILVGEEDGKKIYEEVTLDSSFAQFHTPEHIDDYQCDHCNQRTTAIKTCGFQTYPSNLIVNVQRIKLENWVPVKMDVPVSIPETIDLAAYGAPDFAADEVKKAESASFEPNANALETLLSMGFSEPRSLRALYNSGNRDAEEAMNWVFAHMDDPNIDMPFDPAEKEEGPSQDAVDNLVAMGFSAKLAKKALVVTGDVNAAVEWLFSNPNDNGEIESAAPVVDIQKESGELTKSLLMAPETSKSYELKAVVCHKGTSPHTGHYVAFIKHQGQWILFNDEKVVACDANLGDIRNNAYIYFFGKV